MNPDQAPSSTTNPAPSNPPSASEVPGTTGSPAEPEHPAAARRRRKKPFIITGLIVLVIAAVGIAYMMMSGASSQAFELCANSGSGKCIEVTRLSPAIDAILAPNITTQTNATGIYQRMYLLPDNICYGHNTVTDNCPFKIGSGLNLRFETSGIFQLHFNANPSYCLGVNTSTYHANVVSCLSNTTAWVFDNQNQCGFLDLVNVYATYNTSNKPSILTSSGQYGGPIYGSHSCSPGPSAYNQWGLIYK